MTIIVIIVGIIIMISLEYFSKRLAQYLEQRRTDRLMEIERLREENQRRYVEDYYRRKYNMKK